MDAARLLIDGGASAAIVGLESIPWSFPVGCFALWVSSAAAAHRKMCMNVTAAAVEQLLASSMTLLKSVPAYDHLLSGVKINLTLVSKHLCQWPSKKALGTGCIALEKALKESSKAHAAWGLDGTLRDGHADQVAQVEENYLTAKKALATIAGVNCLANMTGLARLEKRDVLLRQVDLMPESLSALLKKQK